MNKTNDRLGGKSYALGKEVEVSPEAKSLGLVDQSRLVTALFVDVKEKSLGHDDSLEAIVSKNTSRRAWLGRGVAVVSPVVASLVSAPVYAADACLMPSAFASATFASHHPGGSAVICTTQGPNYWVANFSSWPTDAKTMKFADLFVGSALQAGFTTVPLTLKNVLDGNTYSQLSKYCIAAYLNARTGVARFPLSAKQAVDIYMSYHGGSFSPVLVKGWTELQTLAWLKLLMS